jgi:hypothetical protein
VPRARVAVRARGVAGSRAALFLAGTVLVPGCVEEPEPDGLDDQNDDAGFADAGAAGHDGGKDANDIQIVPVYGVAIDASFVVPPYGIAIPPVRDAGVPEGGCPQVGNLPLPVYGVAVDSGPRSDACKDDAGQDAGKDAGFFPLPPYGIGIDGGK